LPLDGRRASPPHGAVVLSSLSRDQLAGLAPIRTGRVVRLRRSGARGVVVHRDPACARSETWYRSLPDRPIREQAWCAVLLDDSAGVCYLAEEELELETSAHPVHHPLLYVYFACFDGAEYRRNTRPWH
jgi:hemimethylated DNA binding protein